MFESNRQLSYLAERVRDDELRGRIGTLRGRSAEVAAWRAANHESVTEASMQADRMELGRLGDATNERLGVVLRELL